MNRDSLVNQLSEHGLFRIADAILGLAKPCVHLETRGEDRLPAGATKLGGTPDLPATFDWPEWKGRPQSFLGQLNLRDFVGTSIQADLPDRGILSFFYDAEQSTWGYDPNDRGSWAVAYFPDESGICPRELPTSLPLCGQYLQCAVTLHESISIPGWKTPQLDRVQLSKVELDAYWKLLEVLRPEHYMHQVFGYPIEVQGDMHVQCQLVTNGLYCGNGSAYTDPRAAELRPGATGWRLLLQIDSDDKTGMMWGDVGMVYFWIHKDDLAECRYGQAWMILQCC
jgi:uncharacterized protein YwqG